MLEHLWVPCSSELCLLQLVRVCLKLVQAAGLMCAAVISDAQKPTSDCKIQ
jgi:hypothetical protein